MNHQTSAWQPSNAEVCRINKTNKRKYFIEIFLRILLTWSTTVFYEHHLKTHDFPETFMLVSLVIIFLSFWTSMVVSAPALPVLPKKTIDTTYSPPTGKTIAVNADGDFQSALNNANLGDTIILQAGATFTGPFSLPEKKTGSGWIYIQSSNYSSLPAPGNRVSPADAANMPKIIVNAVSGGAINTEASAHHYRFTGIEFAPSPGEIVTFLVSIGNSENPESSSATMPHDITFDRCYFHGDPATGARRAVAMNGISVAVVDSYLSDFKQKDSDTQALWSFNSPGPLKIVNNYLEAAGENVMFGGADSKSAELVPADIEIRQNYFFKPLSWVGTDWTVKNLLEFKSARRVLIENNTFENIWGAAQNGFAILITPKNQDGTAPWTTTEDITFKSNNLKNIGSGINISGTGVAGAPTKLASRILIENNTFDVTGKNADGRIFQIISGPADVTINHNTGISRKGTFVMVDFGDEGVQQKVNQFAFTNNIVTQGDYGFIGSNAGEGVNTLNMFFANWTFAKNAIIGGSAKGYPADNYYPAKTDKVGFVNYSGGNYHLAGSSPYKKKATDGGDLGAGSPEAADVSSANRGDVRLARPTNLHVGYP